MCAVSNVGDYWRNNFPDRHPWYPSTPIEPTSPRVWPISNPTPDPIDLSNDPIDLSKFATKEDIDALRAEMEELKKLLEAAINYDEKTGQPHCETDSKIALIKQVAEAVGVDLSDLNL